MSRLFLLILMFFTGVSCSTPEQAEKELPPRRVVMYDSGLHDFILPSAQIEVLDSGYTWTEGPVWNPVTGSLLFSDIPSNRVMSWNEARGTSEVYLNPAGYTGETERGGEMGSNGLLVTPSGQLVLCQHGDRGIAVMEASLDSPATVYSYLAQEWDGMRFNSPNDITRDRAGNYYYTDPPYGLEGNMDDPAKEMDFQGVFKIDTAGTVSLLTRELSRPNGIALSPDESVLYVANSDDRRAIWMSYPVQENGLGAGSVFLDVTDSLGADNPGGPDGMKIHSSGVIFATGPGGIWVIKPDKTVLGLIRTGVPTANCAFNEDESMLYMTADDYLMRIPLISK